jgi:cobalt-zinc-cadmium efflux system membrane fusion protein
VVSGLRAGEKIVSQGAFTLRAELEKSAFASAE